MSCWRGELGSIRNRKTEKIRSVPKTACNTVKTDKFSHLSYQIPNRSDTVSDKWSIGRFRGYSRSVEALNCRSDREETRSQVGKTENHIGYQIWEAIGCCCVFFNENRKLSAKKNGKSASRNEHQNRKAEVFWHKTRLTDLKNSQNCKTENSNATLLYVVGGSSLNRNSRFKFQSCILPVDRVQNRNSILSAIRLEGYCKDLTLSEEFNVQAKTWMLECCREKIDCWK